VGRLSRCKEMTKGAIPTVAQFIILKFTTMEKAIKKAKLLGNTGMVLVIIGLTGLAFISDWQNFYMFVLAVAAVMLVLANVILTDIHKNIK
jgi:glucose uptake protein GlcU